MTETVSSFTSIPPASPLTKISSILGDDSAFGSEVSGARSSPGSAPPSGWSSTSLTPSVADSTAPSVADSAASSVADSTASSAGVVFGGVSFWANAAKPNSSVAMKHANPSCP